MIEFIKVEKGNVKKNIGKQLLKQYVAAGWKQVEEAKKVDYTADSSKTTYTSTTYSYDKK